MSIRFTTNTGSDPTTIYLVLDYNSVNALQILAGFEAFSSWKTPMELRMVKARKSHILQALDAPVDLVIAFGEPAAWEVFHSELHHHASLTLMCGLMEAPNEGTPPFPVISAFDMREGGRIFARHAYEKGYRNLGAVFSYGGFASEGISEIIAEHLGSDDPFLLGSAMQWDPDWPHPPDRDIWSTSRDQLSAYLQQLAKPACLLLEDTGNAVDTMDLCSKLGMEIPHDIGMVGLGYPREVSRLLPLGLTNLPLPWKNLGYQVAEQLNHLLQGRALPEPPPLVNPFPLESRASTELGRVMDPRVRKALRFIRRQATQGLKVADVYQAAHSSRSVLSELIKKETGMSIRQHILQEQLALARELLSDSPASLSEISERCGFTSQAALISNFKRELGMTPGSWRKQSHSW